MIKKKKKKKKRKVHMILASRIRACGRQLDKNLDTNTIRRTGTATRFVSEAVA